MDVDAKKGSKWTKEETILAFDLYCKTPFCKRFRKQRILKSKNLLYIKKEPATKQIPHLFVYYSYYNNTLVNFLTKEDTAPAVEGVH